MNLDLIKGYIYLTVANICLGLNSPLSTRLFTAVGSDHVSPFAMSWYRVFGAALLFWIAGLFTPKERVALRDLCMILLASVFGLQLNQFLYLWGLSLTSPIDAPIIAATVPIMTMILSMIFIHEPITWLKTIGVGLGAFGAIFIITADGSVELSGGLGGWGHIICIAAALSYSIYLTLFKGIITKYSPITTMKWMFLCAATVASILFHEDVMAVNYRELSIGGWSTIAFVSSCGTFVAFLCVIMSQRAVRPTVVSMFNYLQPITSVLFSVVFGVALFDWRKGLAALAIFIGVYFVTQSRSRAEIKS